MKMMYQLYVTWNKRVAIRNNGKKEHIQKRHIYMSIKETHALFIAENENIKISRSKFASLRA